MRAGEVYAHSYLFPRIFAGLPTTVESAGTSCTTTAPIPTTALLPIETPWRIIALAQKAQSSINTLMFTF